MLFLHGRGESIVYGDRNDQALQKVEQHGPPSIGARPLNHYFVVISPQHHQPPYRWDVADLTQLGDYFAANAAHYDVDPERVVVAGISMGADGAWELATARPARNGWQIRALALASPTSANAGGAARAANLPVWIHHGTGEDENVTTCAHNLAGALGQRSTVRFTRVPGVHKGPTWAALFEEQDPVCWGFWGWLGRAAQ